MIKLAKLLASATDVSTDAFLADVENGGNFALGKTGV
jgi:hypothetical protein